MELTIGVREIVAWAIAFISFILFLQNKLRNPTRQYYMAVEGVLVACYKKATFYANQAATLRDSKSNTASLHETQKIYEFVSNDYAVLTQHIFGIMKSIEPKELPVDVEEFLGIETAEPEQNRSPSVPTQAIPPQPIASPPINGIASIKQFSRS